MLEIRASKQNFLGMPVDEFLREHWQKKPLLIRQAFPDYQAPLTPEDLAGLACEENALSRLVQHDRKHDAWRVRSGPFDEKEFPALGDRDWTLLVQDMDKWDAEETLRREPIPRSGRRKISRSRRASRPGCAAAGA